MLNQTDLNETLLKFLLKTIEKDKIVMSAKTKAVRKFFKDKKNKKRKKYSMSNRNKKKVSAKTREKMKKAWAKRKAKK